MSSSGVMKAGKDKVGYEDVQVEVTDYEPGIGSAATLTIKVLVDDEAAAATALSKLPMSVPIERLLGGENLKAKERNSLGLPTQKVPGSASMLGKQVVPPISDPNKYSDHVKKALEDKVKAQAKADKAWKPVPEARYTKGECKYLADKAIEVLWEKVREQQRRLDPSASSLLSPTAPSPSPSLPQVKQRRCDPLREYLDEIPPKSAAAVGTALTDDIFSKPLETAKVGKDETVKPETVKDEELTNKVKAKPGPGTVDQEPLKKVKDAVDEIER